MPRETNEIIVVLERLASFINYCLDVAARSRRIEIDIIQELGVTTFMAKLADF